MIAPSVKRSAESPLSWAFSSVGQSGRLITSWSGVRVPEGPLPAHNNAPAMFNSFFHCGIRGAGSWLLLPKDVEESADVSVADPHRERKRLKTA